jgi:hypothetical protein
MNVVTRCYKFKTPHTLAGIRTQALLITMLTKTPATTPRRHCKTVTLVNLNLARFSTACKLRPKLIHRIGSRSSTSLTRASWPESFPPSPSCSSSSWQCSSAGATTGYAMLLPSRGQCYGFFNFFRLIKLRRILRF